MIVIRGNFSVGEFRKIQNLNPPTENDLLVDLENQKNDLCDFNFKLKKFRFTLKHHRNYTNSITTLLSKATNREKKQKILFVVLDKLSVILFV